MPPSEELLTNLHWRHISAPQRANSSSLFSCLVMYQEEGDLVSHSNLSVQKEAFPWKNSLWLALLRGGRLKRAQPTHTVAPTRSPGQQAHPRQSLHGWQLHFLEPFQPCKAWLWGHSQHIAVGQCCSDHPRQTTYAFFPLLIPLLRIAEPSWHEMQFRHPC